jgi:hypothetical protein
MKKTTQILILLGCATFIFGTEAISRWRQTERISKLPPLPMGISIRKPLLSPGDSVLFYNRAAFPLRVQTQMLDPQGNETATYQFVVAGKGMHEIGWLNGWQLAHGDVVTISAYGYRPWTWRY